MNQAFNKEAFEASYKESRAQLQNSEQITKSVLRTLSRSVLEATHATGNIGYVNDLLDVLTPMNKKACIVFYRHFAGFSFDDKTNKFTKKSAKRYDEALELSTAFLADPMNNIWSWAERNIEVSSKEFDIEQVTDAFKKFVKKAEKANLTQKDVVKAVLKSGVELDTLIALMGELYDVDVNATE